MKLASRSTADHLHRGRETLAPSLGAHPAAQLGDQVHQVLGTLEAEVLVSDEVAERGERLDMVADVRRGPRPTRVLVVHDREGHVGVRLRRGRGVGRAVDPPPDPVAAYGDLLVDVLLPSHGGIEGGEDLLREVHLARTEHRLEDVHPAPDVHVVRGRGQKSLDIAQHGLEVLGDAGADVLGRSEPRPQLGWGGRELLPGQLDVAPVEADDAEAQVSHRLGRGVPAQSRRHGSRTRDVVLRDSAAYFRDEPTGQRASLSQRGDERLGLRHAVNRTGLPTLTGARPRWPTP